MIGSFERIRLVTGKLLRQNRFLIALLLLWPCVLSGILLAVDHGHPAIEDVASILHQELLYGLVLVSLAASVALGTELRARRIAQVLGRAVGRWEYLAALGASAFLPFLGYVLVWLLNAGLFAGLLHQHAPTLIPSVVAELAAGLLLCAVGLLSSVLFPQIAAAIVTGLALAALLEAGRQDWGRMGALFNAVSGSAMPALWAGVGETVLAGLVIAGLAALVFTRKDLRTL